MQKCEKREPHLDLHRCSLQFRHPVRSSGFEDVHQLIGRVGPRWGGEELSKRSDTSGKPQDRLISANHAGTRKTSIRVSGGQIGLLIRTVHGAKWPVIVLTAARVSRVMTPRVSRIGFLVLAEPKYENWHISSYIGKYLSA